MQDKLLFEYAVIRVVPRVEREEFINAGIILFCKAKKYLRCLYKLDNDKLAAMCSLLDGGDVESHLQSFDAICKGFKDAGAIAALDVPSRFRWLTATRSTVVQTSKCIPAFAVTLMKHCKNSSPSWCCKEFDA